MLISCKTQSVSFLLALPQSCYNNRLQSLSIKGLFAETKGEDHMDMAELKKQKRMNVVEDERKRVKEFLALFAEKRRRSGRVGNLLSVKEEEEIIIIENEEREDCFILDSDPNDSLIIDLSELSISSDVDTTDIFVLAEKGQVACRDYPHSRHLCIKNPFGKTPHDSYCELCYCFVCDKVASCEKWSGVSGHCHAIDNEHWSNLRRERREIEKTKPMNSSFVRMP